MPPNGLKDEQINLKADVLPVSATGKDSALAWQHNLQDLMPVASCILKLSEMILTKCRSPKETKDMVSGSSIDASTSIVLTE